MKRYISIVEDHGRMVFSEIITTLLVPKKCVIVKWVTNVYSMNFGYLLKRRLYEKHRFFGKAFTN